MANPTQISNLALSWLGQNLINSLGDNQKEAKVMNANYSLSRDKVLNDYPWTFALERQVLAPSAEESAFGAQNLFRIPNDVIFVHRVYRPSNTAQTNKFTNADWTREGQFILSREDQLWALFVMKVTNSDLFSAAFVHALAARMAADTAMTFTENSRLEEKMEARYEAKLGQAMYADGRQGRTEVLRSTKLTGARTR